MIFKKYDSDKLFQFCAYMNIAWDLNYNSDLSRDSLKSGLIRF